MTTTMEPVPGTVCGRLGDEQGALPLVAVDVEADVCELVATTVVRQTFRNSRTTAVEATYVFPLPDRAGVTSFVADLAGRVVEGRLAERGKAREEYDQAIAAGHRAAIAEEDRPGVFTMRVGNLQPAEEAVVTLTLTGPLPVDDGVAEYRFPLVVAPRFVPGTPLPRPDVGTGTARDTDRVPDASRITPPVQLPGQESPVRLGLAARLRVAGLDAEWLTSSLHQVDLDRDGDALVVRLRSGERLDRDVLLRWPVAGDGLRTSALLAPDQADASSGSSGEPAGTWQLTVVPPAGRDGRRPRDVVVVLDRSGSMTGWKIVAARRAAARVVDTLHPDDRFAVLAFDNVVERPPGMTGLADGSDRGRWAAVSWLGGLAARGGTQMLEPVAEAVRLLSDSEDVDRDRYVVLVTDGQVANEDEVLTALGPASGRVRVFTLGVDRAVNAAFLRRLAAAGAGRCDLVESEERLDDVLAQVHRRIAPPVATGLTVTAEGVRLEPDETAPATAPDLFPGVPLVLAGRWRGAPDGQVRLTVRGDGIAETVRAAASGNPAVRTVWARARVRDLEDGYYAGGTPGARDDDALADRITATSLAHGVLSRFTAFVAVDRDRTTESTSPQPVVQPVELPSGWAPPGVVGAATSGGFRPLAAKAAMTGGPMRTAAMGHAEAHATAQPAAGRRTARPPHVVAEPPVPLAPYRTRLDELVARVEAAVGGGVARWDAVLRDAELLADDLSSVGAPADLVEAVRRLVRTLRERPGSGDSGPVVEAVGDVRRLLASGPAPEPTPGRVRRPGSTGPFWRRRG